MGEHEPLQVGSLREFGLGRRLFLLDLFRLRGLGRLFSCGRGGFVPVFLLGGGFLGRGRFFFSGGSALFLLLGGGLLLRGLRLAFRQYRLVFLL
jgi:hypothetical protein